VEKNAKFLSNQQKEEKFFVMNVIAKEETFNKSKTKIRELIAKTAINPDVLKNIKSYFSCFIIQ